MVKSADRTTIFFLEKNVIVKINMLCLNITQNICGRRKHIMVFRYNNVLYLLYNHIVINHKVDKDHLDF